SPEYRQHPIEVYYEQPVVMFELDGDRLAGVEEHFVVLADGLILVILDGLGDGDDATGDDRDLVTVGQDDSALGLSFVVVLTHNDALTDGFDDIELGGALRRCGSGWHRGEL